MTQFQNSSFTFTVVLTLFLLFSIGRNFEFFFVAREFKPTGIFSWEILKLRNQNRATHLFNFFNKLSPAHIFFPILVLSTICAALLVVYSHWSYAWLLYLPVFLGNLLIQYRNRISCDGSDSMANVINISLLVAACNMHSQVILQSTLVFISLQVMLSFFFSGISKITAPTWASGEALYNISKTNLFGHRSLEWILEKAGKRLNKKLNVVIAVWQCAFPFAVLLPLPFFLAFLVSAILFHLSIAWFMGLYRFLWIYVTAYPAIIYCKCYFFKW